jgi:hypothetical protein
MPREKFCPVCKNKNEGDAEICDYCGVPFGAPGGTPITTVPVETIQPELLVKRSEHLQHLAEYPKDALIVYVMDQDQPLVVPGHCTVVLGRAVATDAVPGLADLSAYGAAELGVSRQHARIGYSDAYTIADIGSTNGTWLNQARLTPHRPYTLHSGDEVRLGSLRLAIYYQDEVSGNSSEDVILLIEAPSGSAQRSCLTMAYLAEVVGPYLAALAALQRVIEQFQGRQSRDLTINTISALRPDLPIGISLSGVSQAVLLVKNFVQPWRNEFAADLRLYLTGQAPAPVEGQPSTTASSPQMVTTMVLQSPGETSPATRQKALADLQARLPRLAQTAAEHLEVLLAADQKGLAEKLLPHLSVLATSRLQMVVDKVKLGS